MDRDDMILISVDDHVVVPPDLFATHLAPGRYRDEAPRLVRRADGTDVWTFRGAVVTSTESDGLRPGRNDVHDRIRDMNAGGVLASMNYPSFSDRTVRLLANEDAGFWLALVRAYNDWHVDEWCAAYPGRLIPLAAPVPWDAELCAAEVRRVAAKGVRALAFTENPTALGCPSFHDEYWNPLWRALVDTGTVLSMRIGALGGFQVPAVASPADVMMTLTSMNIVSAATDLLCSRVLREYPTLRIALSDGGAGWIPYFLERVDRTFETHATWTLREFGGKMPSDVFRQHFLTGFASDPLGVRLRHEIGIDNIAWECDYPHRDAMWPGAPEALTAVMEQHQVPDHEIDRITHENAMRWYSFDPFAHVPRELATVGALRKAAEDNDVSGQAHTLEAGTR